VPEVARPPLCLYTRPFPVVTSAPEAPVAARRALEAMGPLRAHEKIVTATFLGMVVLWGAAATCGLDSTAVAFLGLGILLATSVLTLEDIAKEGDVLATFIWFAVLFTLSGQLNALGFMGYLGERLAGGLGDDWIYGGTGNDVSPDKLSGPGPPPASIRSEPLN